MYLNLSSYRVLIYLLSCFVIPGYQVPQSATHLKWTLLNKFTFIVVVFLVVQMLELVFCFCHSFFFFSSLALSLLMTEETFSLKPPQDCRQSCCCCAQQLSCLHQFCHWIRRKSLKVTGDLDISTDDISNKPGQWPPVAVSLASQQLIVAAAGFHLMTTAALIDDDDVDDSDNDEYDDDGDGWLVQPPGNCWFLGFWTSGSNLMFSWCLALASFDISSFEFVLPRDSRSSLVFQSHST